MIKNNKAGIKDIAKLAGVSIGTVDRVLHQRGRVSLKTERKVKEIIKRIQYAPNMMARFLVKNKKYSVALLIPQYNADEYWKQAYMGAKKMMRINEQQGVYVKSFFYSPDNKISFQEEGRKILEGEFDGIIMAPFFLAESIAFYKQCNSLGIPVIMFNTLVHGIKPLSFIATDSFQSGKVAAELLSRTSGRSGKFVILHFDEEIKNAPHMIDKEKGFISYLNEHCPERKCLVQVMNNSRHAYQNQLKRLFSLNKIDAIFVSTAKTYRIGEYLERNKIQDIILVGYDLTCKNVQLLRDGYISFLINQNPQLQVELCLDRFVKYFFFKEKVYSDIIFPAEIITPTNLSTYLQYYAR